MLYLEDQYLKEWDARVIGVKDGKYVTLDRTAFYPKGGGQPHDTGIIGNDYNVIYTGKFSGSISHEVDREGLKEGDKVHCRLDWDRRYKLMRMHTAAHLLSAVFHTEAGALITGNQLDPEKSRIDFSLEDFDKDKIQDYVDEANRLAAEGHEVEISYMDREEALKDPTMVKLANALPPKVKELRIVKIGDIDRQADGGTHVKNTSEIGTIRLLNTKNKGKDNRRVYYTVK